MPKPRHILIRNDVRGVEQRGLSKWLERNTPQIGVAVKNVEFSRLCNGATEINPFAKLPIIERPILGIRSRQRRNQFSVGFGSSDAEDRHFVAQSEQFAGEEPDQVLNAAGTVAGNRRRGGGDLGDTHVQ